MRHLEVLWRALELDESPGPPHAAIQSQNLRDKENFPMQPRSRFDFFRLATWIAAVCIALPVPAYAQKGKGGGPSSQTNFKVEVRNISGFKYTARTYLPTCSAVASGNNNYSAVFPRHDLCATVTTSPDGYQLTDDIVIEVFTTNGLITSVKLTGQDVIGETGIAHESGVIPITPAVIPYAGGFTVYVNLDNIPIWKLSRHLGGKRVAIVGYISLGDMKYSPQQ